jgi:hypothetical protein
MLSTAKSALSLITTISATTVITTTTTADAATTTTRTHRPSESFSVGLTIFNWGGGDEENLLTNLVNLCEITFTDVQCFLNCGPWRFTGCPMVLSLFW